MPCSGNKLCKLIFGTGAPKCATGFRDDFVEYTPLTSKVTLDGIAEGLQIAGEGIVEYMLTTINDTAVKMRLKAFLVPGLKDTHLISPQGILTHDGLRGSFEAHCNEDDPESFASLRL